MIAGTKAQAAVESVSLLATTLGLTGLNALYFRVCMEAHLYQIFLDLEAHPEALKYLQDHRSRVLSRLDEIRCSLPDLFD